jgi:hypothetical protein
MSHTLTGWWMGSDTLPWGCSFDIRNISNIEVSGLTFNRSGIVHGQNVSIAAPASPIKNVKIHDNIFNYVFWAIFSSVKNDVVHQDIEIYNNTLYYCQAGISSWVDSDTTNPHSQYVLRANIHHNTINNLYSIDSTNNWTYALARPSLWSDHEGISLQDSVDCTVADNVISCTDTHSFSDEWYGTRGITVYLTDYTTIVSSGNKFLRNKLIGRFRNAFYLNHNQANTPGWENNIFAFNVLCSTSTLNDYCGYYVNSGTHPNQSTDTNYIINNTINYATGNSIMLNGAGHYTINNNILTARTGTIVKYVGDRSYYTIDYNNYNIVIIANGGFMWVTSSLAFNQWQADGWGGFGPNPGFDKNSVMQAPLLRPSDSALTTASPVECRTGGTTLAAITGISGITSWPMTGVLAIDGEALDPGTPAMGAYAVPVDPLYGGGLAPGLGLNGGNVPPWMRGR